MGETLVEVVKEVQESKYFSRIEREKETQEAIEEFRERNYLLNEVIAGRTTFHEQYLAVFEEFSSGRVYLPYQLPENFEEQTVALGRNIGDSGLEEMPLTGNAPILGLSGGLAGVAVTLGMFKLIEAVGTKKPSQISRRRALRLFGGIFGTVGTLMLGVGGLSISNRKHKAINQIEENAIYLDRTIHQLYH